MHIDNSRRALQPGQVDIWFCATQDRRLDSHFKNYETLISDEEREQYQQMASSDHGRDYLISRALLRTVLARYCDTAADELALSANEFGKPQLDTKSDELQFNTAHSPGLTLCAVSRAEVGIDAEYHSDAGGMLDAADDYLSARELQALRSHPADGQLSLFFRYWTLKEAYLKARGEGLSTPLHDFSIILDEGEFAEFDGPDSEQWDFRVLAQNEQYTVSLALREHIESLNYFQTIPLATDEELPAAGEGLPKYEARSANRLTG